jgi:glycosyltransferase involved in cell wall biosynthesis
LKKRDFSLITGPGSHSRYLVRALQGQYNFDYTEYWPEYKYSNEGEITKSDLFDAATFLLYGLRSRLNFLSNRKWHQDVLFPLYDRINNSFIKGENLIAWPQVSLKAMRRIKNRGGRIILEQPMIHVDAWNSISDQEYTKFDKKNNAKFSSLMIKRMKHEYELADSIIVHSSFSKQTFVENGVDERKLIVCPLGIDLNKISGLEKKINDRLQILYVGRVELLKGLHYLLEAFSKIKGLATLHIAGSIDDSFQPFIKETPEVKFYGQLDRTELTELYKMADVFAFPSLYDGFGMVILEAMSHGIPVIASKNSAGPDIIQDFETGFLIDPEDVSKLSDRLAWMSQNREKARIMGETARQLVEREFGFESYRGRVLKIIKDQFYSLI